MAIHTEVRLLAKSWQSGQKWPKRLDWIEVKGIRGWTGQRVEFQFPITAIVGENGSGKSTLLQAAASVYQYANEKKLTRYASEFFPDTAWEKVTDSSVRYGYTEGTNKKENSIRKPTTRWLGNVDRPNRIVKYIDLSRIQPVSARVGYAKIAKTKHKEASATVFDPDQLARLSSVMGRTYDSARMALADIDDKREIPVIAKSGQAYSGFHQGSGETTIAELLRADLPKYSLVLIDELESSLHPRAQRRIIRDLAERCRDKEIQIVLTTHSPFILEELPHEARKYILEAGGVKEIVTGVSPQFAMSKMDDDVYPECDVYVEDEAAKVFLGEILARYAPELFSRCQIVPFGSSQVGAALGQMVDKNRFPRPSRVYLDGDCSTTVGCSILPGGDAPEQVVFRDLKAKGWAGVWALIGRDISDVSDACSQAMTLPDHHEWVRHAATKLKCGGEILWYALCAEWAKTFPEASAKGLVKPIEEALLAA